MKPRTDRRTTIERRTWRTFLAGLFAPVMFSRRRGERRNGFDRRRRVSGLDQERELNDGPHSAASEWKETR